ncbi:MAG TPA: transcriptional regulator [Acidimicrobiales bacterium]|nr:transcriptional regulator [Acidimicrobiales bacterium]
MRDDDLAAFALLSDPLRRDLYRYVAGQDAEVGRDDAAAAVGVGRSLAAFHLDKLVERGLLDATYRRLSGRTGPGSGRPAKLYRRSARDHSMSVPARRYDVAARLLAEGIEEGSPAEAARRFGREAGAGRALPARAGRRRRLAAVAGALDEYGYEPVLGPGAVLLRNCPFHALVEDHRPLVCGMSLALLEGLLEGMAASGLAVCPESRPGYCCAAVRTGAERG